MPTFQPVPPPGEEVENPAWAWGWPRCHHSPRGRGQGVDVTVSFLLALPCVTPSCGPALPALVLCLWRLQIEGRWHTRTLSQSPGRRERGPWLHADPPGRCFPPKA